MFSLRTVERTCFLSKSQRGREATVKIALIIGITGQDGSYLAELLLTKGYVVHGLVRRSSSFNTYRIDHLYQDPHVAEPRLILHYGDLADASRLTALVSKLKPDEIYNLGAQSHVRVSFDEPAYTGAITGLGVTTLLEAVRQVSPTSRVYQASSSEMFGSTPPPQDENSVFQPRSPYGASKLYAYWMTKNYREAHGLFAVNGILFNHESPRRGETFVTRKITMAVARIKAGMQEKLYLGNIEAVRDWGYAPEYVYGMWQMLQVVEADDYVLATGREATVREFLAYAFTAAGLDWRNYVECDPRYFRPTEVDSLIGNSSKAERLLGWKANVQVADLASLMVEADSKILKDGPMSKSVDKPKFI